MSHGPSAAAKATAAASQVLAASAAAMAGDEVLKSTFWQLEVALSTTCYYCTL